MVESDCRQLEEPNPNGTAFLFAQSEDDNDQFVEQHVLNEN